MNYCNILFRSFKYRYGKRRGLHCRRLLGPPTLAQDEPDWSALEPPDGCPFAEGTKVLICQGEFAGAIGVVDSALGEWPNPKEVHVQFEICGASYGGGFAPEALQELT